MVKVRQSREAPMLRLQASILGLALLGLAAGPVLGFIPKNATDLAAAAQIEALGRQRLSEITRTVAQTKVLRWTLIHYRDRLAEGLTPFRASGGSEAAWHARRDEVVRLSEQTAALEMIITTLEAQRRAAQRL